MKNFIMCIFLVTSGISSAFAQLSNALEQLTIGNYEIVEKYFATLQKNFSIGLITEYEWLDAYKIFYQKENRYKTQLDNWVKTYPNSPSAYLARGVYYRKLGEFIRGEGYISQVPPENLAYIEQMFSLSKRDLGTSLRLNPKSYLTILHLLNIAQYEGENDTAKKYLDLGNKMLPSNFILRARYLISLAPRWGGSYPDMKNFIDECRTQGLPKNKIDLLYAIVLNDLGFSEKEQGNMEAAYLAYEKALIFAQAGGSRFRQDYMSYAVRICKEPKYSSKPYCR